MKVLKFGGTSVGSSQNIKKVAQIVQQIQGDRIVVLSAMSGTTSALHNLSDSIAKKDFQKAKQISSNLFKKYKNIIQQLYDDTQIKSKVRSFVEERFEILNSYIHKDFTKDILDVEKIIVAQGEILSTHLFAWYMEELSIPAVLLSAFDFMRITSFSEPDIPYITERLCPMIKSNSKVGLYITQGYICLNHRGEVDNLKRGGSDYTASLIGVSVDAEEIQIWTDIDGIHNNDPRYVENTFSIKEISFDEAAELAYFGAKILHPQSVIPARNKNIPVFLKDTFHPNSKGTVIKNCKIPGKVRAIAAKDGIIAIKIKSFRMLMAYGFLRKIFEIFEKYKTAIDIITTSEVAVSLTIDDITYLQEIVKELKKLGNIEIDKNLSIICLAGNFSENQRDLNAVIFDSLADIPIRMISYGGSNYNISIVVSTENKVKSLQALNKGIFFK